MYSAREYVRSLCILHVSNKERTLWRAAGLFFHILISISNESEYLYNYFIDGFGHESLDYCIRKSSGIMSSQSAHLSNIARNTSSPLNFNGSGQYLCARCTRVTWDKPHKSDECHNKMCHHLLSVWQTLHVLWQTTRMLSVGCNCILLVLVRYLTTKTTSQANKTIYKFINELFTTTKPIRKNIRCACAVWDNMLILSKTRTHTGCMYMAYTRDQFGFQASIYCRGCI